MWKSIPDHPLNPPPPEGDLKREFFFKFVKLFNFLNFLLIMNSINGKEKGCLDKKVLF